MTAKKTDREKAEQAVQKLIEEEGYSEFSTILCPACNEPEFGDDIHPNWFTDADRTGFQIDPCASADADNPWDHICVTSEKAIIDGDEQLRVEPHMHDYSMEVYQDWQAKIEEMEDLERRREENAGLGEFS